MYRLLKLVMAMFALVVVTGCSGGSSISSNAYAGTYRSAFTRAISSQLLVTVDVSGNATVVVSDATGIVYKGSGTVNASGVLNASAASSADASKTVTFNGSFISQGGTLSGSVSASGDFTASVSMTYVSASANVFQGNYTVTYTGAKTGTFSVTIDSTGKITGTTDSNSSLTGQVSASGSISGTTSTGATFMGNFFLMPGGSAALKAGTWTSPPSDSGLWTAVQIQIG